MASNAFRASGTVCYLAGVSPPVTYSVVRLEMMTLAACPKIKLLPLFRISVAVIYLIASRTNWLSDDPMLWFTLMLMPTGPPAMKLTALAEVNGSQEGEKLSIAKFLCVSSVPLYMSISDMMPNTSGNLDRLHTHLVH